MILGFDLSNLAWKFLHYHLASQRRTSVSNEGDDWSRNLKMLPRDSFYARINTFYLAFSIFPLRIDKDILTNRKVFKVYQRYRKNIRNVHIFRLVGQ